MSSTERQYRDIAQSLQSDASSRQQTGRKAFTRLGALDSELATRATNAFGTDEKAAAYLARELEPLGNRSAYQALADGDRDKVLQLLAAIEHGMFL